MVCITPFIIYPRSYMRFKVSLVFRVQGRVQFVRDQGLAGV